MSSAIHTAAGVAPSTKGVRTRDAILATAIEHFGTMGRAGARVPVIARSVGITPSAVYAYFPSKQALFEAAVDADVACLVEDAFPEIDRAEGEIDLDLHLLFKRLVDTLRIHPLAQRVLAGGEGDGVGRWMQLSAGHRLRTALTAVVLREQSMGRVRREIDATVLALGLETILASLLAAVLHESGAVPTEAEEAVFAALNAALRPSADG